MKGLDPRGEISDGYLKLRGDFGQVVILHSGESKFNWELDIRGGGELYLDITDGSETASGSTVYLMSISTNNVGDRKKSLVLQETQQIGQYRRIGLFSHWDWEKQSSPEPLWTVAEIVIV
ncbi:hypothetical protein H2200_010366 [Cladophialophora chaetospira]|uniref:Uncharacterized protein n=1 Tax=Cladophialophora chaetospira TaxID=386627 RepID=A0AA38X1C2_9EURO|nr:hypothetical protein H2200_010366 [Cladophialophora chaetospira]